MDLKLKQRIVGSLVFLSLLTIFLPTIFFKLQNTTIRVASVIPAPPQLPDTGTVVLGNWYSTLDDSIFSSSQWMVQLGTFNNSVNANQLLQKLKINHVPVFLQSLQSHHQQVTGVYIGPLKSQQQADLWQQQVQTHLKMKGIVKRVTI